jgi:hypothetical protein
VETPGLNSLFRTLTHCVGSGTVPSCKGAMPYVSVTTIQTGILDYLSDRPGSQNTLEDIARWWAENHQVRIVPQRLKLVIAELVRKGALCEHQTTAGLVYGVGQKKERPRKTNQETKRPEGS